MQAQLLSTVPPRSIDIGDGNAANDETFAVAPTSRTRTTLSLAPSVESVSPQGKERSTNSPSKDDYWLGGYAGI
jgi:hypothetical protein